MRRVEPVQVLLQLALATAPDTNGIDNSQCGIHNGFHDIVTILAQSQPPAASPAADRGDPLAGT
jgi:hypothetical protein